MGKRSKFWWTAVLSAVIGLAVEEKTIGQARRKAMRRLEEDDMKFHEFYAILLQWVHMHNDGKTVGAYLKKLGYNTVAIYGMKELGERLYDELKDTGIEVKYMIDKNADTIYADVDVVEPEDTLEEVDVIVVTAIHYFDEIEEALAEKIDCPVISLEDIVFEL